VSSGLQIRLQRDTVPTAVLGLMDFDFVLQFLDPVGCF
jgi:hypothetical protein